MLLATRMTLAIMIILCVVVQLVDGNQRIVHVSEVIMKNSLLQLLILMHIYTHMCTKAETTGKSSQCMIKSITRIDSILRH